MLVTQQSQDCLAGVLAAANLVNPLSSGSSQLGRLQPCIEAAFKLDTYMLW